MCAHLVHFCWPSHIYKIILITFPSITPFPFDLPCSDTCLSYRKSFGNNVSLYRQYVINIEGKIFISSRFSPIINSRHLLNSDSMQQYAFSRIWYKTNYISYGIYVTTRAWTNVNFDSLAHYFCTVVKLYGYNIIKYDST